MEIFIDKELIQELIQVFCMVLGFSFGLSTFLQILAYGIFKAFSLVNIKNHY